MSAFRLLLFFVRYRFFGFNTAQPKSVKQFKCRLKSFIQIHPWPYQLAFPHNKSYRGEARLTSSVLFRDRYKATEICSAIQASLAKSCPNRHRIKPPAVTRNWQPPHYATQHATRPLKYNWICFCTFKRRALWLPVVIMYYYTACVIVFLLPTILQLSFFSVETFECLSEW